MLTVVVIFVFVILLTELILGIKLNFHLLVLIMVMDPPRVLIICGIMIVSMLIFLRFDHLILHFRRNFFLLIPQPNYSFKKPSEGQKVKNVP